MKWIWCGLFVFFFGLFDSPKVKSQSLCLSRGDCCSIRSTPRSQSTQDTILSFDILKHAKLIPTRGDKSQLLPCCGSSDEVQCGADGFCYQGPDKCLSAMDDPSCNIPSQNQIDIDAWHRCRDDEQNSIKMQALRNSGLYGGGPLHEATLQGRTESVEWLLEEGHDVNERGFNGASVLHMAAVSAHGAQIVDLFLSRGATLNQTDDFGYTPLHRFIENRNIQAITMLLAQGANVNLPAPGYETPLHLAAYENARDVADLLLAYGADPFARNDRGLTPFEVGLFDMSVPPHHMT